MKRLKWIALGVVITIIVIIGVVILNINGIVRQAVETGATDSLNLRTTLGSANISLLGGSVGLSDLEIASPQGFAAPHMFTLGGINLGVSVGELRSDPIGIGQIKIDKPHIVVEQVGGKFNFQVLTEQQSKTPPDAGKPGDGKREPGEPIRMIIHDLQLNDAIVTLRPGVPGLKDEINVTVPSLQMKDVGSGEGNKNGAAIKEVVADVMSALVKEAAKSDKVPPELRALLTMNADQMKQEALNRANKEAGKLEGQLEKKMGQEAGQKTGDAVLKGIGGMLGGNKPASQPK